MKLSVLLIGEGTSDLAFETVLETLVIAAGAEAVEVTPGTFGHDPVQRIVEALAREPFADLLVLHRDADAPDPEPRRGEVRDAAHAAGVADRAVLWVPVQETEAWLLVDEEGIRRAAGNPAGRKPLNLPKLAQVEATPRPKELLAAAILLASEQSGRRRDRLARQFDWNRARLLCELDPDGPVSRLPSFQRFRSDLEKAVHEALRRRSETVGPGGGGAGAGRRRKARG